MALIVTITEVEPVGIVAPTGVVVRVEEGGPRGLSAYQVAMANGFEGTEAEWLQSIDGNVGLIAHEQAEDPHPQYATDTAVAAAVADVQGAVDSLQASLGGYVSDDELADALEALPTPTAAQVGADPVGTAAGLLGAHTGALDPHPQYVSDDELAAALEAQAATTTGAISAAIAAHEALVDAHPGYVDDDELAAALAAQSLTDRDRANHSGQQPSTTISDFKEAVQDAVAELLGPGSNIVLTYDDENDRLTIDAIVDGAGVDPEAIRDAIGVALVGVGLINVTVNDEADTIAISTTATANSTDAQLRDRSTHTGLQAIATVDGLQAALDAKVPTSRTISAGTGLSGGGTLAADRSFSVLYGDTEGTAAQGNDPRFSTIPDASVDDGKVKGNANISLAKTVDSTASGGRLALTTAERTKLGNVPADTNTALAGKASTSHSHDYASTGHTHVGYEPVGAARAVRVNGTTTQPDSNGLVDLGTLSSGPGGGATALDDLTDVDTTGIAPGKILGTVDGSTWVPVDAPAGGGGGGVVALTEAQYDTLVDANQDDPTVLYVLVEGA